MNAVQQGIITLIRSSLTGQALPLPECFDLDAAYPQILRHGILTLAYDGALLCGIDKKTPAMKKLFQGYVKCLIHSEGQMQTLEKVCSALDKHGFDYLLFKGSILKGLYPKPELRQMGDADILIRQEQYKAICTLMESLGFQNTAQGFYDYGWKNPSLYVELHHCLSNPYNSDFNQYLGDGWPRAKKSSQGTHRFEYSLEDHFIYLFIHFTKHYRDGGIGIKHAADLWVYKHAYSNMDEHYVVNELKKMQLDIFYANVLRMTSVWFEDGPRDSVTDFIEETLFRSGAFGTNEMIEKAVSLRAANKAGSETGAKYVRIVKMLFPDRIAMQPRYPILKKYPFLLPALWPIRWADTLLFERKKIQKQRDVVRGTSKESIQSYRQALNYVGLNYTIKD